MRIREFMKMFMDNLFSQRVIVYDLDDEEIEFVGTAHELRCSDIGLFCFCSMEWGVDNEGIYLKINACH